MLEVVARVVPDEGKHCHGIAANHTNGALCGCCGLRGEGDRTEDALLPAIGLGDQRHGSLAATTQHDGAQRHALGVVVLGGEHIHLGCGGAETRVGVRCGTPRFRSPVLAGPVGQVRGCLVGLTFPPYGAVISERHVGEDSIALRDCLHGVGVSGVTGAGRHAEKTRLGVNDASLVVLVKFDPRDIVADHFGLPPINGGIHHRKVGFTAGRGECGGDVAGNALRVGDLEDEHVLSHPALIMTDNRGDTQCITFLAQQCIAAITRPEGPDFTGLGELHNVLLGVAGPGHVCLPGLKRSAYGVKRLHEEALSFVQFREHILADSCHNAH